MRARGRSAALVAGLLFAALPLLACEAEDGAGSRAGDWGRTDSSTRRSRSPTERARPRSTSSSASGTCASGHSSAAWSRPTGISASRCTAPAQLDANGDCKAWPWRGTFEGRRDGAPYPGDDPDPDPGVDPLPAPEVDTAGCEALVASLCTLAQTCAAAVPAFATALEGRDALVAARQNTIAAACGAWLDDSLASATPSATALNAADPDTIEACVASQSCDRSAGLALVALLADVEGAGTDFVGEVVELLGACL
jgi:hypothetical protein